MLDQFAEQEGNEGKAGEPKVPDYPRSEICDTIVRMSAEHGVGLGKLSRIAGRNEAYLQQFVKRGTPHALPEDVRLILAQHFNIDERLLGARDPWTPTL